MANQALNEQETTFTIEATDRNTLRIFSNDVVWQRRIEALGITQTKGNEYGKFYTVDLTQFGFGIRKRRQLSDEQRTAIGTRLASYRTSEATEEDSDDE